MNKHNHILNRKHIQEIHWFIEIKKLIERNLATFFNLKT